MLPLPRVLVVDDDKRHADAIADALRRAGVECVPALYDGENPASLHPALRGIRILLSDLHLIPLSQTAKIAQICQPLVELITGGVPEGTPFVLVLWTAHPEELADVRAHLAERLPDALRPLAIHALDKTAHLAGGNSVTDANGLVAALSERLREMPAAAALLEWEEILAKSARSAIDELHRMVNELRGGRMEYGVALASVLSRFAESALGKPNMAQRPAAGLSEVMMPLIADALSAKVGGADAELWRRTLDSANEGAIPNLAARMNGRLHVGSAMDHGVPVTRHEPGAVLEFPTRLTVEPGFFERFGQTMADMKRCILRNGPGIENLACRPVLIRVDAACDYAQGKPGPQVFLLGAVVNLADKKSKSPENWWESPPLKRHDLAPLADADKVLFVNTRALFIPNGDEINAAAILFRLRPPLAMSLAFHLGTRTSRPGIIEFH